MSRKEVIKEIYENIKDIKEGDVIHFAVNFRYYYGKVVYMSGELFVVSVNNNSEFRFKLTKCSCIKKIENKKEDEETMAEKKTSKKATKTVAKKVGKEVEKVPVQKVKKLTRKEMDELGGKIVKFMQTDLNISKEELLKVNRRAWLLLREL